MKYRKLVLAVPFVLAGCQSQYGDMKFFMGGVDSTPLTDDREMIVARGNAYTDMSRIQQFILLKAAEDCLAKGYTKFGFVNAQNTSNVALVANRAPTQTDATVTRSGFDRATVSGTTYSGTTTVMPVVAPGETVIVKFFKGGELTQDTFDAAQIVANLGPKLKK